MGVSNVHRRPCSDATSRALSLAAAGGGRVRGGGGGEGGRRGLAACTLHPVPPPHRHRPPYPPARRCAVAAHAGTCGRPTGAHTQRVAQAEIPTFHCSAVCQHICCPDFPWAPLSPPLQMRGSAAGVTYQALRVRGPELLVPSPPPPVKGPTGRGASPRTATVTRGEGAGGVGAERLGLRA